MATILDKRNEKLLLIDVTISQFPFLENILNYIKITTSFKDV